MPSKNTTVHLNDDLKFLIACCQTEPTKDDTSFILSYLNTERLDLNALISLANQHGILPLVYKTLKKVSESDLSPSSCNTSHLTRNTLEHLLVDLKSAYSQIARRNMLMSAELIRIMKLLEDNGIEALAFKGPVLSQMAYGDITLRQYSDLDILIQQKDVYQTNKLLSNHNYQSSINLKYLKNSALLDLSKDIDLYNQKNNILIELHWNLFESNLLLNSEHTNFLDKKTYIKINGNNIKTLSTDLLLLYLCIHGSKHIWERIEWIVDIDKIIRIHPAIDWTMIIQLAHKQRSINMLLLGLSLSSKFFDTPLPENIKIKIEKNSVISVLILSTIEFLNKSKGTLINSSFKKFQYYSLLQGKSSSKLQQLSHALFDISKEDFMLVKLPRNLKPLYYIIRPIRLIHEYCSIYIKQLFKK